MTRDIVKGEKNMKRRNKKIVAASYVIIGLAVALLAVIGAVYMWFSGEFLPGLDWHSFNWWLRKALYALAIAAVIAGCWLTNYGWSYLTKKRR